MKKFESIEALSLEILALASGLLTNAFYDFISDGKYQLKVSQDGIFIEEISGLSVIVKVGIIISTFAVIMAILFLLSQIVTNFESIKNGMMYRNRKN